MYLHLHQLGTYMHAPRLCDKESEIFRQDPTRCI